MKKTIVGAGGGGGKGGGGGSGHVPVEAPDSLQSKAYAHVMDVVCEGEIEGLADGLKSVYLDGTPIENTDGSMNFSGVVFDSRVGTQDQDYLPGFTSVENEVTVGVEVTKSAMVDVGVVRTITNESVDAIRVRISIPQLTRQNTENGDLVGSEVTYFIELQSDGGGYEEVVRDTVIGKSTSKYERSYRVELEGPGPWDIRVRRQTLNSLSVAVQNRTIWESYAEIIDGKLRYPNSALAAITVDASQFSQVPTRGYDLKLLKIKIPSNATVRDDGSLTYDGAWDGTFQVAWSSNPAWVMYDLLTAERYGLGNFIPENHVDKWSLYAIGVYCDELIDDGFGGTEPRFSCNIYFQSRAEAFRVIQDLASVFRGMPYWAEGVITVVQDAPADATHLFTPSNVADGLFTYSGSSARSRHTVAIVTWNDPTDLYRQKVEYVEDQLGIARYGVIETQITALGCTSQGQANRLGKWLLYSEQYQTEVVSFKTGLGGVTCRPGQVIKIADPSRAGSRRGGRISSATTSAVTIDQELSIDALSHTLSVLLPDGSIETRQLTGVTGFVLDVATPFSVAPDPQSIWMIASATVEAQQFKIVSILEAEDGTYEVSALAHDPDKYDGVELGLKIEPPSISSLSSIPDAPSNLSITETLYSVNADVRVKVTISWNYVSGATRYVVQYQRDSNNITVLPETSSNEIEILNAEPGVYSVSVYAVNSLGIRSAPSTATKEVLGRSAPPASVQSFSLIPLAGVAYLSWEQSTDLDVLIGGSVRIRYSSDILDPVWKSSVDIIPALPGTATRVQCPALPGVYMAKFVDSSGVASNEEASIVTTVPEPLALNVVETITESPAFDGVMTDMVYTSEFGGGLTLSAGGYFDDIVDFDEVLSVDYSGGIATSGTYDFDGSVDLGEVFPSRVTASIKVSAVDVADAIDQRLNNMDEWLDLDGEFIDDVNAELFMQTTLDDPSDIGAEWTEWKRFFVGEYAARGFRFQLRATSTDSSHNIIIQTLAVTVDMPDRVVNIYGIASGASTYSVLFDQPFHETPSIGITAYNLNSGDYSTISSETRSGFDIVFRDSGGNAVSRNFDVLAKGYGRQVS